MMDKSWKQMYARLSSVQRLVETGSKQGSPTPDQGDRESTAGSEQSNVTGYSTFPDTDDSEINSPEPPDPWDRLEWCRTHWDWDDETYQYSKTFSEKSS